MALDFDKLDSEVDLEQLQKDVAEAADNNFTIPKGKYIVKIEELGLKGTKADPGRPMLAVVARIVEADDSKGNDDALEFIEKWKGKKMPCLYMNRVLKGTKNDSGMISSATGFLVKLEAEDEDGDPIIIAGDPFKGYGQLNETVLDIAEAIDDMGLEYLVDYDEKAFNSISIVEVLES